MVNKMIVLENGNVKIEKGEFFSPKHITCERLYDLVDENNIALCDFVAFVEFDDYGRLKHCRDAIAIVEGKDIVFAETKQWSRLRRACEKNDKTLVNVPGGYYPMIYSDEIAVDNFNMSGSSWFVIKKSELKALLDSEPKISPEEAKKRRLCGDIEPTTSLHNYLLEKEISLNVIKTSDGDELIFSEGGSCCHHNTHKCWDEQITDGNVSFPYGDKFPYVKEHINQYHIGCIDGTRTVAINDYKYVIEVYNGTYPNGCDYTTVIGITILEGYENDQQILDEIVAKLEEKVF